jgi:hypothetical protein
MTSDYTFYYIYFLRKIKYWYNTFFLGKVLFQEQYKWRVDKVTFCDRQSHYISWKVSFVVYKGIV